MRMSKRILTVSSAVLVGMLTASPGQGATIVYDPSNYGQAVQQVSQLTQQLALMQQQYQQLMQAYQAIAHLPQAALKDLGQRLNVDQFRNALPAQSSVLGAIMNGTSAGTGELNVAIEGYANQNRIYFPAGQDFQANEMQRNAQGVAGAQAVASELYQSAANHVVALQGMEDLLASAPDAKAVADIQARLLVEQAYIQAQLVQAQSLAIWQASQERNQVQRAQEERRRQIDQLIDAAKAHGG